jgi:hypothetical protein
MAWDILREGMQLSAGCVLFMLCLWEMCLLSHSSRKLKLRQRAGVQRVRKRERKRERERDGIEIWFPYRANPVLSIN